MSRKRILVFIDWFRPGYKAGGPVQSLDNLTARLSPQFDFDIVTRNTDYCDTTPYPGIKTGAWVTRKPGVRVYYLAENQLNRNIIEKLVSSENYDWYYINGIYSRWFSIMPVRVLKQKGKSNNTIIAVRGMLAPSARAIKATKKILFLTIAKLTGLYKGVTFHATATEEVTHIEEVLGNNHKILLAGNLSDGIVPPFLPLEKEDNTLRLICLARIAPEKNTLFALQCLQHVSTDLHIDFYGTAYDAAYEKLCREEIDKLPANITATWCGAIAKEGVHALLQNYHGLFLPSRGENFGHVILETLTAGRPVIISDQTPWKNLEQESCGYDLPLDDEKVFAAAIDRIAAMDQVEYDMWCNATYQKARAFINDPELEAASIRLFDPAKK